MSKFLIYLACYMLIFRIYVIVFFLLFLNTKLAQMIIYDPIHHYQVGIIGLVASVLLLRKSRLFIHAFSLSLTLIIDEYTVILYDLGVRLPYLYGSIWDWVVIIFAVTSLFLLSFLLKRRPDKDE